MLKHTLHYLIILTEKVNEDVFIYLAATAPPIFIINWSEVSHAVMISCITGVIPVIIKHAYRKLFTRNNKPNE